MQKRPILQAESATPPPRQGATSSTAPGWRCVACGNHALGAVCAVDGATQSTK